MAVKKAKKATTKKAQASTSKAAKKTAAGKKAVSKAPAKKKAAPKAKQAAAKSVAKKKTPAKKKTVAKTKAKAAPKKATTKAVAKKKAPAKKKATTKSATVKKKSIAKTAPIKKPVRGAVMSDEPLVSGVTLPVEGIDPYQPSKGESYMSDEQYAHYRHILIEWKKQLMQEVDRTVDHMKTDAANYADPADRATQEEEFSLELRTRDRERKLIKKIDESLSMIDTGDYGYCESCGIEIGIRRLEARPTATQCIDCKTLQEIKEKQIYS
jgi:DnaK suppressor protein